MTDREHLVRQIAASVKEKERTSSVSSVLWADSVLSAIDRLGLRIVTPECAALADAVDREIGELEDAARKNTLTPKGEHLLLNYLRAAARKSCRVEGVSDV